MNLLSQRIKEAKRELTALKTAHRRGLGLLKVYTRTYTVPSAGQSGLTIWWLTLDVTVSVSAYPFIQMYHTYDNVQYSIVTGAKEFEYKNSGYLIEFRELNLAAYEHQITIYSTSPIESISHQWSER